MWRPSQGLALPVLKAQGRRSRAAPILQMVAVVPSALKKKKVWCARPGAPVVTQMSHLAEGLGSQNFSFFLREEIELPCQIPAFLLRP